MYQATRRSCQLAPDSSRRSSEPLRAIPMTSSIIARRRKKLKMRRRAAAVIMILLVVWVAWSIKTISDRMQTTEQPPVDLPTTTEQPTAAPSISMEPAVVPIVIQAPEKPPRYKLTAEERDIIERVVTAEAVGEPFAGQVAVAQCILNACEKDGIRPLEVLTKYKYAKSRPDPEGTVPEAVAAVFDDGWYVTTEPILYFYAPDRTKSDWHESQDFVIEINGHRFFAEKPEKGAEHD